VNGDSRDSADRKLTLDPLDTPGATRRIAGIGKADDGVDGTMYRGLLKVGGGGSGDYLYSTRENAKTGRDVSDELSVMDPRSWITRMAYQGLKLSSYLSTAESRRCRCSDLELSSYSMTGVPVKPMAARNG
jgi:hypothetical protein